jgi:hypothetical protein
MPAPIPTPIYHITHWKNLAGIVASDGLFCCTALRESEVGYHDLANQEIQDIRARTTVQLDPGGTLHDYVPFYFAPRSPMLYKINCGGASYPERQNPIVHLVTTAQDVDSGQLRWLFTDGHAIINYSGFYADLTRLGVIDWPLMVDRDWADTQNDPNRKCRRQAEFLVHRYLPWLLVHEIGVRTRAIEGYVREAIKRPPSTRNSRPKRVVLLKPKVGHD